MFAYAVRSREAARICHNYKYVMGSPTYESAIAGADPEGGGGGHGS